VPIRILIADDEAVARRSLRRIIAGEGLTTEPWSESRARLGL